jgi:uncharacterized membrane protein
MAFDLFGKKNVMDELGNVPPYKLLTEFVPYKLYANRKASSSLMIKLKNQTGEALMTSIVVELPRQLSFGGIGIEKEKELRLGILGPNEEKEARIDVYGDSGTDAGEYTLGITAFSHYRDYGHILNYVKKKVRLDVV